MANLLFSNVPKANVQKSDFDLSHTKMLTAAMGALIPAAIIECIPGDSVRFEEEIMVKLQALISPVFHKIHAHLHAFFVPNRILWDSWEDFITMDDSTEVPQVNLNELDIGPGTIGDYFGLPLGNWSSVGSEVQNINTLPFRAYLKIYYQFYVDPEIQTPEDYDTICDEEGAQTQMKSFIEGKPRQRNWEFDYFTSARTYAQRGEPVWAYLSYDVTKPIQAQFTDGTRPTSGSSITTDSDGGTLTRYLNVSADGPSKNLMFRTDDGLGIDINELRYASALQRVMEMMNKTGHRYKDWLKGFFGVDNKDSRLNMVEYLGGTKVPIVISEVLSTTSTLDSTDTETMPVGTMAGRGVSLGKKLFFKDEVTEHGFIMVIMSILPETVYAQGLNRMFTKLTDLDYPLPQFAQLGEQEVLNKELYYQATTQDELVFGYVPRYEEYRYIPNQVHGDFRDTLKWWTLYREFSSLPLLGNTFLQTAEADFDRIFAIENLSYNQCFVQLANNVWIRRALPQIVTPGLS